MEHGCERAGIQSRADFSDAPAKPHAVLGSPHDGEQERHHADGERLRVVMATCAAAHVVGRRAHHLVAIRGSRVGRHEDGEQAAGETSGARPREVDMALVLAVQEPLHPEFRSAVQAKEHVIVPVEDRNHVVALSDEEGKRMSVHSIWRRETKRIAGAAALRPA